MPKNKDQERMMETIELKMDDPEICEAIHDALLEIKAEVTNSMNEVLSVTASESDKRLWLAKQMAVENRMSACRCGVTYIYRRQMSEWDEDMFKRVPVGTMFRCLAVPS
jgi:hypothetical protein